MSKTKGCNYQGYEFGAGSYPDSVCIGGVLHDADACDDEGNLYVPDEEIPCPICNKTACIEYWTERNSSQHPYREAREMAKSLVTDIRKNRGLKP